MPDATSIRRADDTTAFLCAMIERLLLADGLDPDAVSIVEQGLSIGRLQAAKPPNPLQQPERWYPGLGACPWHNPRDFPWVAQLEASFLGIRDEAIAAYDRGRYGVDALSGHLGGGSWREYRLFSSGTPNDEHCRECPKTVAAIERIPSALTAGLVYFASAEAGTHVQPHWGPHNARLRCHLGLVVPEGCELRVGAETRGWQEGKVIVFDDSFEHEVYNRGDATRLVLVFDIWHPDLTPPQALAIRYSELPLITLASSLAAEWVRTGTIQRERHVPRNGAQTQ